VTRARAGYSNHNFGVAWDIGLFKDGKYLEESPLYRECGEIGKSLGLEWGGDWKSIQDEPHFEVRTGLTMAEKRARISGKKDLFE
jgi:peptidoglycan L-alanyl-D-glutamate endopeptidase CwlK